jgi:hypothetical protein
MHKKEGKEKKKKKTNKERKGKCRRIHLKSNIRTEPSAPHEAKTSVPLAKAMS